MTSERFGDCQESSRSQGVHPLPGQLAYLRQLLRDTIDPSGLPQWPTLLTGVRGVLYALE